eukprot:Nitzschia sp. Nitz4//scaffold102_size76354//9597//11159//NITZ4_005624-RA/size76354-processed-gene-0.95-mRNA-1//1//CDS//3329532225//5627//frame0
MDRTHFLRALPFLHPLEDCPWPPPLPTKDNTQGRREIWWDDHFWLSMEPYEEGAASQDSMSQLSILRPRSTLFFKVDQPGSGEEGGDTDATAGSCNFSDPAMCPIQVIMQRSKRVRPSSTNSHSPQDQGNPSKLLVSPSAYRKLTRSDSTSNKLSVEDEVHETALFWRIHETVYQVDLAQVENIDIQMTSFPSSDSLEHPSILLQFGALLVFRIFRPVTMDEKESRRLLSALQESLIHLLTKSDDTHVPAPCPIALPVSVTSPSGGSSTTLGFRSSGSQEPGQGELDLKAAAPNASEETPNDGSSIPDDTSGNPKSPAGRSQQSFASVGQVLPSSGSKRPPTQVTEHQGSSTRPSLLTAQLLALKNVQMQTKSLDAVLFQPVPFSTPVRKHRLEDKMKSQVQTLVTQLPIHLADSYASPLDLEQGGSQSHMERISKCREEMDTLIQSFWPSHKRTCRPNHRHHPRASPASNLDPPRPTLRQPADVCIEKAKTLLDRHRGLMEERISLLGLPTRDSTSLCL